MNKFLVKILIPVIIIAGLVLYLKFFKGSPSPESGSEVPRRPPEVRTEEDVMANYRQQREQAAARTEQTQPKPVEKDDLNISALEAERLYQFAETQFKIGQKVGMSYKQVVDTCREIIKKYPDTEYAPKAKELLRKIPERYRQMWNVTNEELGL